jgi:hypothetical protein
VTERVEVDVADLEALRQWGDGEVGDHVAWEAAQRLVRAIPKPRLVPTEEAIKRYITGRRGVPLWPDAQQELVQLHAEGLLDPKWMVEEGS